MKYTDDQILEEYYSKGETVTLIGTELQAKLRNKRETENKLRQAYKQINALVASNERLRAENFKLECDKPMVMHLDEMA